MNINEMSDQEKSETIKRNICMDCGKLIDLAAHDWYARRNPNGTPRRCSSCAFDAIQEMIDGLD